MMSTAECDWLSRIVNAHDHVTLQRLLLEVPKEIAEAVDAESKDASEHEASLALHTYLAKSHLEIIGKL
jgi:hypothetical protein